MAADTPPDEYYWDLILRDGRTVPIPPKFVSIVKRNMIERRPILTSNETIPFAQIQGFERTSKKKRDEELQEGVARAFNEPIVTDDGVKARWVKKSVARNEYEKRYSKHTFYRYLGEEEGMVTVAMILPVHRIDTSYMEYCTTAEEQQLNRY